MNNEYLLKRFWERVQNTTWPYTAKSKNKMDFPIRAWRYATDHLTNPDRNVSIGRLDLYHIQYTRVDEIVIFLNVWDTFRVLFP